MRASARANTWYAIGALRLRQGRLADANAAFERAIERVATHPMAQSGAHGRRFAGAFPRQPSAPSRPAAGRSPSRPPCVEPLSWWSPALLREAARIVDEALAGAAPGNAGWLLPIEPLLHVTARPDVWARPLAHLRNRAA